MTSKHSKAVLVDIVDPKVPKSEALSRLEELESLIKTYGGVAVVKIIQKRSVPDYETYVGKGKVEEIIEIAKTQELEILVVNNLLKSRQLFNLQEMFRKEKHDIKVWDRLDLILKIFDKHAQSTEAKLQIELASIHHMGARIYGMGIELSRQAGAMGVRAGQGESNTEMMKRHLRDQELNIMKKLKHYELIREGHRQKRKRRNLKTVALVGYTNAGKSSLLNALTNKGAYVADKLFATLDTRVGKIYIQPNADADPSKYIPGKEILVSDTIGFIQDLPPDLIKAFKSTLSETVDADVILHVIDVNDPHVTKKIEVVEEILDQLGLNKKPKIYVFNKIDLIHEPVITIESDEIELTEEDLVHIHDPSKPRGMLKAGKRAAHILGWAAKEQLAKEKAKVKMAIDNSHKLAKKYAKFNPLFVSAHKKINLEKLIEAISLDLAK